MKTHVRQGLAALEAEDLSGVVRLAHKKMRKAGVEPVLSEGEAEIALKQYYALPLLRPGEQQFAVSSIVDEYWHWHILDTLAYQQFCQRIYGFMMHHGPLDPDDEPEFSAVTSLYERSRNTLLSYFGDLVSPVAYPAVSSTNAGDLVVCVMYDAPAGATVSA